MTISLQYINTGTSANKGNGDPLRVAFTKINRNFATITTSTLFDGAYTSLSGIPQALYTTSSVVFNNLSLTGLNVTLANTATTAAQANGAGIRVNGPATTATILYASSNDTWNINKTLNVPGLFVNGEAVTPAALGDITVTDNILGTANTDQNIVLNPNGNGRVNLASSSLQFDNGNGLIWRGHLMYTAPNAGLVGLGIDADNASLRIVGDSTAPGRLVDFGMYEGTASTWVSKVQISTTGTLIAGSAYDGSIYSDNPLRVDHDVDSFGQVIFKNHNSGTNASTDLVIMNDQGDSFNNFIDIGINSSNYSQPSYSVTAPGDGYVFTNGGDLVLGTQTPNTALRFHVGGTEEGDAGGYLDQYGWTLNRRVEVIVSSPAELRFKVQNQSNNSAAKAVFAAINDIDETIHFGLVSSNPSSVYGNIKPNDGFLHIEDTTATLHIGAYGDLALYADSTHGYQGTPTVLISKADQSVTFTGDLLPDQNNQYSIGSPSRQWKDLYVSTGTIYIGGVPLTVDTSTNGLTVNGIPVTGSGAANTGNVTFNGVKVIGAGTASGDGLGYSTLELVPDGTLVSDQYIVVDPTAPNHIHLRAGGTQDASTAALFLGGELNYVRAVDGNGVRLNNAQFIPDSAYFEQGVDYDSATWSTDESGNHWIDIVISDPFNPTRDATPINTAGSRFAQYPTRNSIEVFTGSSLFTVSGNGQAYTLGNPYNYRIGTVEAPPANPTTLASLDYRLNTFNERYLYLENNTLETYADTVSVFSGQTIDLVTGVGNIRIATDDNNSSYSWYFTAQGYLQFPQGLGPTTSKGKAGDEAGSVVVDGDYIYYCHTDYTDGLTDIWKRVQWSADTW